MPVDTISYDILPHSREFDELGNIYYLERLVVEANTQGASVTPTLDFNDTDTALTSFSTTSRVFTEIEVNRLGPLDAIEFTPINSIFWYGVEMFIRPVELGVQIVNTSAAASSRRTRITLPGRTSDATDNLTFDINPFSLPEDARHVNPLLRYLWIDIETGAESVTPVLVNNQGTETTLSSITAASRGIQEFSILATNRIKSIRLDGDFTNSSIILYDIECDMYIPNKRRMSVG